MSERAPDYAQGFKDGFAAGLEEGKKISDKSYAEGYVEGLKKTIPPPYVPDVRETCPKCGIKISGVMGYVCGSINCPIQYRVTSGIGKPMTAVSYTSYTTGIGHNLDTGLGKAIWK